LQQNAAFLFEGGNSLPLTKPASLLTIFNPRLRDDEVHLLREFNEDLAQVYKSNRVES
jgi:hypothetical protein